MSGKSASSLGGTGAIARPGPLSNAERLSGLIREATGNVVPGERLALLDEIANRRTAATRQPSVEAYLYALSTGALADEWSVLIGLVTIKESYFFRAPQQLDAIIQKALPARIEARSPERRLRIWSAACARGEEPATIALMLAEHPALLGWDWQIVATDLDTEALAGAERGLYGDRAVAQVPPALLEKWFTKRGKLWELSADIRRRITYRQINLAHPPYELPESSFDLILLRNVLIYFRRPLQRKVANQVARRLAPGAYLFLGASETLWQIHADLEPVDLGPCFGYIQGTARPETKRPEPVAAQKPRVVPAAAPKPQPTARPQAPPPPRPVPARPVATATVEPASPIRNLEVAALALAGNRLDEAARHLESALAREPENATAHALQGFLDDLSGRPENAVAAYRAALYLNPDLYQARLLLADRLLHLGQARRAEHEFREVLSALLAGKGKELVLPEALALPDRERALRRCRQALGG
ncbi:MAG: CheR family methyltransferase [Acidobacteriota bacterium]